MDKSCDHPALRIELGGVGDKIKIYLAVDYMIKNGKKVAAQVNNEIPEYAIKAYKTQCRIATYLRKRDASIKTRVGIDRGDIWPSILQCPFPPHLSAACLPAKERGKQKKGGKAGKTGC